MIKAGNSFTLHGGLCFKKSSTGLIEHLPVSSILKINLKQHHGEPADRLVAVGQKVFKGQALTQSDDLSCTPVHASSSGTIDSIEPAFICIKTHGQDQTPPKTHNIAAVNHLTPDDIIKKLHRHGIVGLGGASYPAAKKIVSGNNVVESLLINAAECDPQIYCDDALIQNHAEEIVRGIELLCRACNANSVIVGIEDNKPLACSALTQALANSNLDSTIITIASIYPSGAEHLLYKLCIGKELSTDPSSRSVISFNVATCFAAYEAICLDQPLISRVTTVVDANDNIRNFRVRIGTPVEELFHENHSHTDSRSIDLFRITDGGRMMGKQITSSAAVNKSSNCIAFTKFTTGITPRPCIRCGNCADVCPEFLLPQNLYTNAVNFDANALNKFELDRCIQCACCDLVCPSHIPLSSLFHAAKVRNSEQIISKQQAEKAKMRFEKRKTRLWIRERGSLRRRSLAAATHEDNKIGLPDAINSEQKRKQLIEAALVRTRNKKGTPPKKDSKGDPGPPSKNGNSE